MKRVILDLPIREDEKQVTSGIVRGTLAGLSSSSTPLLQYAFRGTERIDAGISAVDLNASDIGKPVILGFEQGDPHRPVLLGFLFDRAKPVAPQVHIQTDGDRLCLSAEKEIVLTCGEASITLTRSGKILLRGSYLLSRSTGVNRVKGGSVQIN